MATRRNFTQEYKDQAVSLVLDSGRSIAEVAKSIGVHEMTLGKWVKKAREAGRVPDSDLSEPERAGFRALLEWGLHDAFRDLQPHATDRKSVV